VAGPLVVAQRGAAARLDELRPVRARRHSATHAVASRAFSLGVLV
jgi:hypothetical protein